MDVLGLLPALDRPLFHRSLAPRYRVRFADSWVEGEAHIRQYPVAVLAADLCIEGRPDVAKLRQLRVMFPSVSVFLWVSLDHDVAKGLVQCGAMGIATVLLRGYDNDSRIIGAAVAEKMSEGVYSRTLDLVIQQLGAGAPARLRWALREIFNAPSEIRTAEELGRRADVDTRTVFRWFRRGRLATPHRVITAARVLLAGRMLQDPGFTVDDVARRLGYSDSRYLAEHTRRLARLTPGELRLSFEEALPRLVAAMVAEPDALAPWVRSIAR
ncbi:MAG: helix-turn-helix domain-containing protein [Gemmatimonadetes bacterium]|nr:helix-turn-helix domain-containing protein [Gemmatimonadota bacterium]